MYEPEPGRETPEEKRLREVKIEVKLTNTNNITDIEVESVRQINTMHHYTNLTS